MTTVMLVAAMVPMALGRGPGAGTRASMAKVILGGQLLSLLLTLLVTPVAYSLFDGAGGWLGRLRGGSEERKTLSSFRGPLYSLDLDCAGLKALADGVGEGRGTRSWGRFNRSRRAYCPRRW